MEHVDELRVFLRLCDTLSYRRTSELEHLSPSTLTRVIQRLERRAARRLVDRGARGVSMTSAGLAYADYARATLAAWDAYREGQPASPSVSGHIRLFATPTAATRLVPSLLRSLADSDPAITVDLETGDALSALARVLEGSCDIAIVPVPRHLPADIAAQPLTETRLVFAGVERELLAPPARRRYLLPGAGIVRDRANAWFRTKGIVPDVVAEPASHEAVLALALAGQGVAVLPELVLQAAADTAGLHVQQPRPRLEPLSIALCVRRTALARPAVAAFWSMRSVGPDQDADGS